MKKFYLGLLICLLTSNSFGQVIKQKLDSLITKKWSWEWYPFQIPDKSEFAYDAFGNTVKIIYYEWENDELIPYRKTEEVYEYNGNRTTRVESATWNQNTNQFDYRSKTEYSYDTNDNLILSLNFDWDEINNQWTEAKRKNEYNYDSNNNILLSISYVRDENNNLWVLENKSEYTYDNYERLVLKIIYGFNDWEEFVVILKEEHTFDNDGNLLLYKTYLWDHNLNQLIFRWKKEYTYDNNSNITQYIYSDISYSEQTMYEYTYDTNNNMTQEIHSWYNMPWNPNQWENEGKRNYSDDENNNNTQLTEYFWDEEINDWVKYNITDYTYDPYQNLTLVNGYDIWGESSLEYQIEYIFDSYGNKIQITDYWWEDGELYESGKTENTYDNSFSYLDLILPPLAPGRGFPNINDELSRLFNHMLLNTSTYRGNIEEDDGWELIRDFNYYYSEQVVSSVYENSVSELNVYPNPFSEYVTFNIPENHNQNPLELFDMQGRMIMSLQIKSDEKVNMQGLNQGVYFYNLLIDGEKVMGKLIKQ